MAPASHMPAPVVSPFTSPCERKMAPAARKATPAVTASMTRIGSVFWPADSRSTPAWISMVMMVNSAAASAVSMWVRRPAGRAICSRSKPITAPRATASNKRAAMTPSERVVLSGSNIRRCLVENDRAEAHFHGCAARPSPAKTSKRDKGCGGWGRWASQARDLCYTAPSKPLGDGRLLSSALPSATAASCRLGYFAWLGGSLGDAGWSSPVARQAHNLKVVGSNPTPATNKTLRINPPIGVCFVRQERGQLAMHGHVTGHRRACPSRPIRRDHNRRYRSFDAPSSRGFLN